MNVRVGIFGAGMMGEAHAQAYRDVGATLVGVTDTRLEAAQALARRFDCRAYASKEELLDAEIDAVSICLPHRFHAEAALMAAAHRKHILMEKPLAVTLQEADAIISACRAAGVRLMVGFIHRFLTSFRELRSMIESGAFGEIGLVVEHLAAGGPWPKVPAWYLQRAVAGGGILMMGSIHAVDRIRWLLGSEVASVYATVRQIGSGGDVEDVGAATLVYDSGARASIAALRSPLPTHPRRHTFAIYGTTAEATITLSHTNTQTMEITTRDGSRTVVIDDDQPFRDEIQEFLSSIVAQRDPQPDGEAGRQSLATILAMYESARRGEPVDMKEFLQTGAETHERLVS